MGNINAGDTALVLISAALVCLMTPGLAFFYGGLVRRKNVLTIMMQNFISMGIVTFIWVFGGFSLAFSGDVGGVIGNFKYFLLNGVGMAPNVNHGSTIPFLAFFVYQEMFAVITPALITGAFADRINFKSYLKILTLWSIFVYVPVTHWVWGGGFLAQMGVVDFAGGIVVHVTAGVAALVSVIYIGKRKILPLENTAAHNVAYVALGTGLLWFGWFGFNGGSALAANGVAAIAFANTDIAGSVAMIMWLLISWSHEKKPSMIGALTGAIAGLATITPCAGYVEPWAALVIGLLSAIVCYTSVQLMKKLHLDDALDVWGVHGVGGILGSILVGVFANKSVNGVSGLIYGNVHQFYVQLAGVGIVAAYTCVITFAIFKVVDVFDPVRVKEEIEMEGLDEGILGETAYSFEFK